MASSPVPVSQHHESLACTLQVQPAAAVDEDIQMNPIFPIGAAGWSSDSEDEDHLRDGSCSHDDDSDALSDSDTESDTSGTDGRRGSAVWWYRNRRNPIVPGHAVSAVQAAYWVAMMKQDLRMSDAATNSLCRLVHYLILPKDNYFPPSYFLVRAVLGVAPGVKCIRHVCDTCWTLLPPLSPEQYELDDHCQGCGRSRFTRSVCGFPLPRRCVYYFGELESVLHLLTSPGMLEAIVAHRRASLQDPGSFFQSPAGLALDKSCGFKFSTPGALEVAVLFSLGVCTPPSSSTSILFGVGIWAAPVISAYTVGPSLHAVAFLATLTPSDRCRRGRCTGLPQQTARQCHLGPQDPRHAPGVRCQE